MNNIVKSFKRLCEAENEVNEADSKVKPIDEKEGESSKYACQGI